MSETEAEAETRQFTRICVDEGDHFLCPCVVGHARAIMKHWTGTNCTWVDDDITALGILANMAIQAGLYKTASIPDTMIAEIERKMSSEACTINDAD